MSARRTGSAAGRVFGPEAYRALSLMYGRTYVVAASTCERCKKVFTDRLRPIFRTLHPSTVVLDIDNDQDRVVAWALFSGVTVEEHLSWAKGAARTIRTPTVVVAAPWSWTVLLPPEEPTHPTYLMRWASATHRQVKLPEVGRLRSRRRGGVLERTEAEAE